MKKQKANRIAEDLVLRAFDQLTKGQGLTTEQATINLTSESWIDSIADEASALRAVAVAVTERSAPGAIRKRDLAARVRESTTIALPGIGFVKKGPAGRLAAIDQLIKHANGEAEVALVKRQYGAPVDARVKRAEAEIASPVGQAAKGPELARLTSELEDARAVAKATWGLIEKGQDKVNELNGSGNSLRKF